MNPGENRVSVLDNQVHSGPRAGSGLEASFDTLLHSPKARAAETAELPLPLLRGQRKEIAFLAQPPPKQLLKLLTEGAGALVGHQPWLGQMLAWLVPGEPGPGERFVFNKGGVAILEAEPQPGGMRLVSLLPPEVLRAV